ncbi:unnamed protein product [Caenorhabditis bovis]|uniref:Uncharacterized protein n=1 Tax=Caenorhabditis bovis TaxID=2654633 RepID=A0A8S1F2K8_9PELO|nr:unnamed protein product [Caenorhabditis bovis]
MVRYVFQNELINHDCTSIDHPAIDSISQKLNVNTQNTRYYFASNKENIMHCINAKKNKQVTQEQDMEKISGNPELNDSIFNETLKSSIMLVPELAQALGTSDVINETEIERIARLFEKIVEVAIDSKSQKMVEDAMTEILNFARRSSPCVNRILTEKFNLLPPHHRLLLMNRCASDECGKLSRMSLLHGKFSGNVQSSHPLSKLQTTLFAKGSNKCFNLGIMSDGAPVEKFRVIDIPSVRRFALSNKHSVFATNLGKLYGCGKTANLLFGADQESQKNGYFMMPTEIALPFGPEENIYDIAAADTYTAILTNEKLYIIRPNDSLLVDFDNRWTELQPNLFVISWRSVEDAPNLAALLDVNKPAKKSPTSLKYYVLARQHSLLVYGNNNVHYLDIGEPTFDVDFRRFMKITQFDISASQVEIYNEREKHTVYLLGFLNLNGTNADKQTLELHYCYHEHETQRDPLVLLVNGYEVTGSAVLKYKVNTCKLKRERVADDLYASYNERALPVSTKAKMFMKKIILEKLQITIPETVEAILERLDRLKILDELFDKYKVSAKCSKEEILSDLRFLQYLVTPDLFLHVGCFFIIDKDNYPKDLSDELTVMKRLKDLEENYNMFCMNKGGRQRRFMRTAVHELMFRNILSPENRHVAQQFRFRHDMAVTRFLAEGKPKTISEQIDRIVKKFASLRFGEPDNRRHMWALKIFSAAICRVDYIAAHGHVYPVTEDEARPEVTPRFRSERTEAILKKKIEAGLLTAEDISLRRKISVDVELHKVVHYKANAEIFAVSHPKFCIFFDDNGNINLGELARNIIYDERHMEKNVIRLLRDYFFQRGAYSVKIPEDDLPLYNERMLLVGLALRPVKCFNRYIHCIAEKYNQNIPESFFPERTRECDKVIFETLDQKEIAVHKNFLLLHSESFLAHLRFDVNNARNGRYGIEMEEEQPKEPEPKRIKVDFSSEIVRNALNALRDPATLYQLKPQQIVEVLCFCNFNLMEEITEDCLDILIEKVGSYQMGVIFDMYNNPVFADLIPSRFINEPEVLGSASTVPLPIRLAHDVSVSLPDESSMFQMLTTRKYFLGNIDDEAIINYLNTNAPTEASMAVLINDGGEVILELESDDDDEDGDIANQFLGMLYDFGRDENMVRPQALNQNENQNESDNEEANRNRNDEADPMGNAEENEDRNEEANQNRNEEANQIGNEIANGNGFEVVRHRYPNPVPADNELDRRYGRGAALFARQHLGHFAIERPEFVHAFMSSLHDVFPDLQEAQDIERRVAEDAAAAAAEMRPRVSRPPRNAYVRADELLLPREAVNPWNQNASGEGPSNSSMEPSLSEGPSSSNSEPGPSNSTISFAKIQEEEEALERRRNGLDRTIQPLAFVEMEDSAIAQISSVLRSQHRDGASIEVRLAPSDNEEGNPIWGSMPGLGVPQVSGELVIETVSLYGRLIDYGIEHDDASLVDETVQDVLKYLETTNHFTKRIFVEQLCQLPVENRAVISQRMSNGQRNPISIMSLFFGEFSGENRMITWSSRINDGQPVDKYMVIPVPPVKRIAMSNHHTILLTNMGVTYGCGKSGNFFDTGIDPRTYKSFSLTPQLIPYSHQDDNMNCIEIGAAETYTVMFSHNKRNLKHSLEIAGRIPQALYTNNNMFSDKRPMRVCQMLVKDNELILKNGAEKIIQPSNGVYPMVMHRGYTPEIEQEYNAFQGSLNFGIKSAKLQITNDLTPTIYIAIWDMDYQLNDDRHVRGLIWGFRRTGILKHVYMLVHGYDVTTHEVKKFDITKTGELYVLFNSHVLTRGRLGIFKEKNCGNGPYNIDNIEVYVNLEEVPGAVDVKDFSISPDGKNFIMNVSGRKRSAGMYNADYFRLDTDMLRGKDDNPGIDELVDQLDRIRKIENVIAKYVTMPAAEKLHNDILRSLQIVRADVDKIRRVDMVENIYLLAVLHLVQLNGDIEQVMNCETEEELWQIVMETVSNSVFITASQFMTLKQKFRHPIHCTDLRGHYANLSRLEFSSWLMQLGIKECCVDKYKAIVKPRFRTENIEGICARKLASGIMTPGCIEFTHKIVVYTTDNVRVEHLINFELFSMSHPNFVSYFNDDNELDLLNVAKTLTLNNPLYIERIKIILYNYFFHRGEYCLKCPNANTENEFLAPVGLCLKKFREGKTCVKYEVVKTEKVAPHVYHPENTPQEDKVIIVASDGGQISVHKNVLLVHSDMLLAKTRFENTPGPICVKPDQSESIVRNALEALRDPIILYDYDIADILRILFLCDYFMMDDLIEDSLDVLFDKLPSIQYPVLFDLYTLTAFKDRVVARIAKNPYTFFVMPLRDNPPLKMVKEVCEKLPRSVANKFNIGPMQTGISVNLNRAETVRFLHGNGCAVKGLRNLCKKFRTKLQQLGELNEEESQQEPEDDVDDQDGVVMDQFEYEDNQPEDAQNELEEAQNQPHEFRNPFVGFEFIENSLDKTQVPSLELDDEDVRNIMQHYNANCHPIERE